MLEYCGEEPLTSRGRCYLYTHAFSWLICDLHLLLSSAAWQTSTRLLSETLTLISTPLFSVGSDPLADSYRFLVSAAGFNWRIKSLMEANESCRGEPYSLVT